MNEWQKIKGYTFDHSIITIYRSGAALRKWMVEAIYKSGATPSQLVFEDEGDAWRRFYDAVKQAVVWDAEPWNK